MGSLIRIPHKMLLYRPNFCCNCGEKIERVSWSVLSSRKFCDLCQTELRGHDWAPTIVALTFSFIALAVISNLFRPSANPTGAHSKTISVSTDSEKPEQRTANLNTTPVQLQQSQNPTYGAAAPATLASQPDSKPHPAVNTSAGVFYCGAATRKGTACSRRVKRPGERCWQHSGMPAVRDIEETRTK